MAEPVVTVFTSDIVTKDKESLRQLVSSMTRGAWADFKTTNQATVGKLAKLAGASLLVE